MVTDSPLDAERRSTGALTGPTHIRTPDQRVRVFVSSTLDELAPERAAAREAITQLRLTPVLFESGARPYPPRELYRAYLAQSDIFIGLYWQRYGWVAPDMTISGMEDEYQLSSGKPKLIYIKTPAPKREPGLQALLDRIRTEDIASYQKFATPEELRERIADDLAELLTERFARPPETTIAASLTPVPVARSRLINRENELAQAKALLQGEDLGLVTLTGPGGVGKTRLALQAAVDLAPLFADGVAFISLASLTDPTLVVPTVARALGLTENGSRSVDEQLLEYLRPRQMLLVLDNVEQLVSAAPQAARMIELSPRLKLLVTSREPLRVRDERIVTVPPLELPAPTHIPDLEHLLQIPAVALFVERAREARPDFALTTDIAPTILEICQHLDGLPLALELAAARMSLLTPTALLQRLKRRLPLLTRGARDLPERQQTLRNTIAWSYDLLSAGEQQLFRRLSAFVSGFTLEAVQAVCFPNVGKSSEQKDDGAALQQLAQLLDKSLVQGQQGTTAEPRFTMLETIHEYATEQLAASGEEAAVQEWRAQYFLALAEAAQPELDGPNQAAWLERLEQEHDNLRATLEWALVDVANEQAVMRRKLALRLSTALWEFWRLNGHYGEGRAFLEHALVLNEEEDVSLRAKALRAAADLAIWQGDYARVEALAKLSLAFYRELGNTHGIINCLFLLGGIAWRRGKIAEALALYEERVRLMRQIGELWEVGQALYYLADLVSMHGEYDRGLALFEEALALFQKAENELWIGGTLVHSAFWLCFSLGDTATVRQRLLKGQVLVTKVGNRHWGAECSWLTALLALSEGELDRALSLAKEGLAIYREMESPWFIALMLNLLGRVEAQLGEISAAHSSYQESLGLSQDQGEQFLVPFNLEGLAGVLATQGELSRAARLWGAAETLREVIASPLPPFDRAGYSHAVAAARTQLGEQAFATAWQEGRTRQLPQLIEDVLKRRDEAGQP